jgi:signal transduction histidine kinase/DNA-binding NarL/FixJ family response regulator
MNKLAILIAEDEGIVAEDLVHKIRKLGYDVVGPTATGEEAVELAKRHSPALILMDIRLAGTMDGITAAEQIRAECDLPTLFLTAHSDLSTVKRAQQAGALGYILKPFDDRDLRIQVEMALYKHSAEVQLRESKAQLAGVNQILQAALISKTEEDLGKICLDVAEKLTQSKFGFLGETSREGFMDIAISDPGWEACNISTPSGHCRPPGSLRVHGIYGRVIFDGKSFFTNDPANHPDSIGVPANHPLLASFLGVPLMSDGKVIGLLAVANRQGGYSPVQQDTLESLTPSIVQAFKRKRAEDALQTLNADLEKRVEQRTFELQKTQQQYLHAEKLSAIGRLSASIAHEFNNPLQGIMAVLKGLRKRAIMDEEDKELLEAAINEGTRIKKLIRSLQEFNRPSSCNKVLMDVQATIDSLLLIYKSEFKNKRLSVQQNYAERLPQIMAIPDQIKQVLLNLLTNAADACRTPGGIITISTCQENDRVAVSIKDTGIGIQPENMDLIFQPFYTTKPEVKGTGLGLSVCHGIINHHQGEIRVESQPDQGTTFTVLLPIQGG